ncbi:ribonuclease catalytic domain-containing protein [Azonexus hydrophilus]|uniref:ribonuclease catalytic domain-containing protein n=1 Tax=Azonexus hydrophilus TaxID=418702 RepID=UPI0003F9EAD0|nr:RNB domain-containing ribonuclease [Azonexus hydrophilus]
MNVLFEEDGGFKAGTIMADNDSSLQVELPTGKRSKIKAATVLLRFATPSAAHLLEQATPLAGEIEADFLWECVSDGEFSFLDFARDYYGHDPASVEATAVLLALHAAPVYFHRKGKGRFRKAPADILAAALANLEKKRQQALAMEGWLAELKEFRLPPEIGALTDALLYAPDRNKPETKAFESACAETGLSAAQLLFKCGAIKSAYHLHYKRFLHEQFPRGTGFPALEAPGLPSDLPKAGVRAFSIDDANTTEIDDALSVTWLPGIGTRIGIHIAAPGLAIEHGSPLDGVARARLSTVYMPGNKITMLPDAVVQNYTLAGGVDCPAVSLYLTVNDVFEVLSHESCVELVHIADNLRHHDVEPWFNAETVGGALPDKPFARELLHLWHFANACEGRRGKPSATQGINDYNFAIVGDLADPESCSVEVSERKRGSPLDKLVAELMIVANSTWGGLLAEKNIACLYRAQTQGKVRMTTSPLPHEGLGVPQYAWMTSPLRRYCDLVNQWQLIACLRGNPPPFPQKSAELFGAMRDFELTYAAYAEFQRLMERYWCLRWLQQHQVAEIEATVRREQLCKLDHLPLLVRVPSAPPDLLPGQRLRLSVEHIDLLGPEVDMRFLNLLDAADPVEAEEDVSQ